MPTVSNSACSSRVYTRHLGIPIRAMGCLSLDSDTARAMLQLNANPEDDFISVVELINAVGRPGQRHVVAKLFNSGISNESIRSGFIQLFLDFPSAFSQIELLLVLDGDLQRTLVLSLYQPKAKDPLRDIHHVFATLPHFDTGLLGGIFLNYLGSAHSQICAMLTASMGRNLSGRGDYLKNAVAHYDRLRYANVKYFSSEWSARIYVMSQNLASSSDLAAQARQFQLQMVKTSQRGVTLLEYGDQAVITPANHVRQWVPLSPSSAGKIEEVKHQIAALFKMLKKAKSDEEYFKLIDTILMLDPRQYRAYVAKAYYIGISSEHDANMSLTERNAIREEMSMNFDIALRGWEDRQRREPRYFVLNPDEMKCYMDTIEVLDRLRAMPTDLNHPSPE
jgi:hypothetical protein